jgi:hypothetical protein
MLTKKSPWYLWPLTLIWDLLTLILQLTGRLIAGALGLTFLIVGGILTALIITAPIGIPFAVFGFALMLRAIF